MDAQFGKTWNVDSGWQPLAYGDQPSSHDR